MLSRHMASRRKHNSRQKGKRVSRKTSKGRRSGRDGGAIIGAGGYGCVFSPPLPCEGEQRPPNDFVSKLMEKDEAEKEFEESVRIEDYVKSIPNYKFFFNVGQLTMCKVGKITTADAKGKACPAIPGLSRLVSNVVPNRAALNDYRILQQPYVGVEFTKAVKNSTSYAELSELLGRMNTLLVDGIVPMNQLGLYHEDLKSPNILVKDNVPRLIDWGFAIKNDGPVTDDRTAGQQNVKMALPMKALTMYNAPLSATYFLKAAWDTDTTGRLQPEVQQAITQLNTSPTTSYYLTNLVNNSLARLEQNGHFSTLRHHILKPAMEVLYNNGIPVLGSTKPTSSQVVFIRYLNMLNREYITKNGNQWEFDRSKFYKNYYHNIDLWGWAMALSDLLRAKLGWASPDEMNRIKLGISKLILYLFENGGEPLDPKKMTGFVHESMEPGTLYMPGAPEFVKPSSPPSPSPVPSPPPMQGAPPPYSPPRPSRPSVAPPAYVSPKQSVVAPGVAAPAQVPKTKMSLGSKQRPRAASTSKVEKLTPSGALPKGMTKKAVTKKGTLTVAHTAYLKSLGKAKSSSKQLKTKLSPVAEDEELAMSRLSSVAERAASASGATGRTSGLRRSSRIRERSQKAGRRTYRRRR